MIPPLIAAQIKRAFDQTAVGGRMNALDVVLEWDAAGAAGDTTFLSEAGAADPQTESVKALVHWVTAEQVVRRGYTALQAGDAILDFPAAVTLTGRPGIAFVIAGRRYIQKTYGDDLLDWPDTYADGVRIFHTIVVGLSQQQV